MADLNIKMIYFMNHTKLSTSFILEVPGRNLIC